MTKTTARRRIPNLLRAINGTRADLKGFLTRGVADRRVIDAHEGQIASLQKDLKECQGVLDGSIPETNWKKF